MPRLRIWPTFTIVLLLLLGACKSKNLPSFPTVPSSSPSSSPSSGMPPPPASSGSSGSSGGSSGGSSSSSGESSGSSSGSSGGSSGGGETGGIGVPEIPSLPGTGSSGGGSSSGSPSVAKTPGSSGGGKDGRSTKGSGDGTTKGTGEIGTGGSGKANREKAGGDLQAAGEAIAKAGGGIGGGGSDAAGDQQQGGNGGSDSAGGQQSGSDGGGDTVADNGQQQTGGDQGDGRIVPGTDGGGSGEVDPLLPELEAGIEDGEVIFADMDTGNPSHEEGFPTEDAAGSSSNDGAEGAMSNSTIGETAAGRAGGGGIVASDELQAEIQAAREALQEAGIAMQRAGEAVANAETDEELAAAEGLLSDARIAVIVATQNIGILADESEGETGESGEDPFADTNAALEEANVLLVIATRSVLEARTGNPNLPDGVPTGGIPTNGTEVGSLEDELDESLVIFDGQIGAAREAVLSTAPPPETGTVDIERPEGRTGPTVAGSELPEGDEESIVLVGTGEQMATAGALPIPEDIPPPQGDDIVAQQLREAAMIEKNPELQEKLWEEYRRYKAGL